MVSLTFEYEIHCTRDVPDEKLVRIDTNWQKSSVLKPLGTWSPENNMEELSGL